MKKVAFIHATLNHKNSLHHKSLILERVPLGAFSLVRSLDREGTETILDGIIQDVMYSKALTEVVIVTSDAPCDKAVIEVCKKYEGHAMPVHSCVVKSTEEYGLVQENMLFNDVEWPYITVPTYGAWHTQGFATLMAQYSVDVALIVQADSALFLDGTMIDDLLQKYAMRGIWCKASDLIQTELAILNVKFANDVRKRYERKIREMFSQSENKRFMRLDKAFLLYEEDSNQESLFVPFDRSKAPLQSLYHHEDLEKSLLLVRADFQDIELLLKEHDFLPAINAPTFLEVELVAEQGKCLDLQTFKGFFPANASFIWSTNLWVRNKPQDNISDLILYAREKSDILMIEFDPQSINGLTRDGLREYVPHIDLFQFNIDPSVKNDILTDLIEDLTRNKKEGRPFIVLRTSPRDIDKYDSYRSLVDKIVIKSSNGRQGTDGSIDFAPIKRDVCRKLTTSFFIDVDGNIAPCRFMKGQKVSMGSASTHFAGQLFETLRDAHAQNDLAAYHDCRACKEWYIPDIVLRPPRNLCFSVKKGVVFPGEKAYDKSRALHQFTVMNRVRDYLLEGLDEIGRRGTSRSRQTSYALFRDLLQTLNRAFIDLGEILFSFDEQEKALDAWERVLQFDPGNERVHNIFERLLAEQDNSTR